MLANILKSEIAIRASVQLVRAFVQLREAAKNYTELERKITLLEQEFDHRFEVVFDSIKRFIQERQIESFQLDPNRKKIGLKSSND